MACGIAYSRVPERAAGHPGISGKAGPAPAGTIWTIMIGSPHFRTGIENRTRKLVLEGLRICVLQQASVMAIRYAPALIINIIKRMGHA